jgi:hypothetical protein
MVRSSVWLLVLFVLLAFACTQTGLPRTPAMTEPRDILATMPIAVPRAANRIASFTNKAAAFYCTRPRTPSTRGLKA